MCGGCAAATGRHATPFAAALAATAGEALHVAVPAQGLHLVAYLSPELPPEAGRQIRSLAGIEAVLLSETRERRGPEREGLILGFSGYDLEEVTTAAKRLGRAAARIAAGVKSPRRF